MDSLEDTVLPAAPIPVTGAGRQPRIWKFWGTALWGLFVFAAMFVGQIAVVAYFVLRGDTPLDLASLKAWLGSDAFTALLSGGLTISLSVIMGLPAVLAALWLALPVSRPPFTDYLALRGAPWAHFPVRPTRLFVLGIGGGLSSPAPRP